MKAQSLALLVHMPSATDYVSTFQTLADVNLTLQRQGPRPSTLLRKAALEVHLGNYAAARAAARDAVTMAPDLGEAHFQAGLASLLLAFAKAGLAPVGPGHAETTPGSLQSLLAEAAASFQQALRLQPDDTEAAEHLDAVQRLTLHGEPSARDMAKVLEE